MYIAALVFEFHNSILTNNKNALYNYHEMAIGGFRSDLSITRKTDGNFGNVSVGVLFPKVAYQRKRR